MECKFKSQVMIHQVSQLKKNKNSKIKSNYKMKTSKTKMEKLMRIYLRYLRI
jgi:hypothetical protein